LLHPRADAVETRIQPERREDSLVVDELLDALEHGAAPLLIQLGRLLAEQAIDVGVAPVRVDAAAGHEGLDAGGGVAERTTPPLDEAAVLLLGVSPEEGRTLERSEPRLNADRLEVVDHGLPDTGEGGVAGVIACVKAVRVTGLGEQTFGAKGIVRVARRLPVELEVAGDDAEGDLREPEGLGLVDGLPVDGVVGGQPHAPVVPG